MFSLWGLAATPEVLQKDLKEINRIFKPSIFPVFDNKTHGMDPDRESARLIPIFTSMK